MHQAGGIINDKYRRAGLLHELTNIPIYSAGKLHLPGNCYWRGESSVPTPP